MTYKCDNGQCGESFPWSEHVDQCPYCGAPVKRRLRARSKHFVQYHKTDQYGPPGSRSRSFGIETNKSVDGLHGNTVWLISGEGTPKKYFLECRFVADKAGVIDEPETDFRYFVKGKNGVRFRPLIPLNGYAWFDRLRRSLADFGAGLSEIGGVAVEELEKLAAQHVNKSKSQK
jgi:hypothetical protein